MPGVDLVAFEINKDELNSTINVIVLALYRPPNINAAQFIIKLPDTIQTLHEQNKHVFLMRDFKIDITEAMLTTNHIVNNFYNLFLSYHFYNLIDKPTRVIDDKPSIIDNINTNASKILVNGIFKTNFSDHYTIFCVTDLAKSLAKNKTVIKLEFNANNFCKFSETLNQTDWGPVYADDTILYCNINQTITAETINRELIKFSQWLGVNKLSLNVAKTKFMVFHASKKSVIYPELQINSNNIERVTQFNFLGLILESNLSWNKHISHISLKVSKAIGILYRLKSVYPLSVLLTLYNTLVLPYFNYGILTWGSIIIAGVACVV